LGEKKKQLENVPEAQAEEKDAPKNLKKMGDVIVTQKEKGVREKIRREGRIRRRRVKTNRKITT